MVSWNSVLGLALSFNGAVKIWFYKSICRILGHVYHYVMKLKENFTFSYLWLWFCFLIVENCMTNAGTWNKQKYISDHAWLRFRHEQCKTTSLCYILYIYDCCVFVNGIRFKFRTLFLECLGCLFLHIKHFASTE